MNNLYRWPNLHMKPVDIGLLLRLLNHLIFCIIRASNTMGRPIASSYQKFEVIGNSKRTVFWGMGIFAGLAVLPYSVLKNPCGGMAEPEKLFPMSASMSRMQSWQRYVHASGPTCWKVYLGWVLQWRSQTWWNLFLALPTIWFGDYILWIGYEVCMPFL